MTGPSHLRRVLGWTRRRLVETLDGLLASSRPRPEGVPPRRLRARVGAPAEREYRAGAQAALDVLADAVAPRSLSDFASVLDFGCGSGRLLVPLAARHPHGDLLGVDVDAEAISWGRAHLEGVEVRLCAAGPPLELPDGSVDLIYSISVFSHLDATAQDSWLAELARVLAPSGTMLLSTHGAGAWDAFARGEVTTAWCETSAFAREPLQSGEMISIPYAIDRFSRGDLPGVGSGYGLSFHGVDYIREHWGAVLEVLEIRPQAVSGWQDLVVLAHRERPRPV